MKKVPLRPRSKRTGKWTRLYLAEKARRIKGGQDCCQHCKAVCGPLQGHHFWTNRINANILRFVILGSGCHSQTNAWLRERGLLALVNGTYSVIHPAVETGEARYAEMMEKFNAN